MQEARDNLVLGIVDYLTKKQMINLHRQIPCHEIPKTYAMGFPWQEKVRGE